MTSCNNNNHNNLRFIFEKFEIPTGLIFVDAEPITAGHINDTYKVRTAKTLPPPSASTVTTIPCHNDNGNDDKSNSRDDKTNCYHFFILQRINTSIFKQPIQVMENIVRITQHLSKKIKSRGGDPTRETLTVIPAKRSSLVDDGKNETIYYYALIDGNYWRVYNFISNATAYEIGEQQQQQPSVEEGDSGSSNTRGSAAAASSSSHVREAAAAFARFQRDVSDLPPPRLYETIPKFGDTSYRFEQMEDALLRDDMGKASECQDEIDFCLHRKNQASILTNMLQNGTFPERIAHYDTKINNVLIDNDTGKGLCVIDLDTVMPGMAIYDFGDAVRAATALSAEDEMDLTKVGFSMKQFELLVEGYMSVAQDFLTTVEIDNLVFASKMVCFTIGLRFLTDFLMGDVYFKTTRENHNLDRARTQFKTVADMEERYDEMKAIVDKYRK